MVDDEDMVHQTHAWDQLLETRHSYDQEGIQGRWIALLRTSHKQQGAAQDDVEPEAVRQEGQQRHGKPQLAAPVEIFRGHQPVAQRPTSQPEGRDRNPEDDNESSKMFWHDRSRGQEAHLRSG